MLLPEPGAKEAYVYTDGASTGSHGTGGYGAVIRWKGRTEEILSAHGSPFIIWFFRFHSGVTTPPSDNLGN